MKRFLLFLLLSGLAATAAKWFVPPVMYIAGAVFVVVAIVMMVHQIYTAVQNDKAIQKAAQANAAKPAGAVKRPTRSGRKGDPLWFMWSIAYAVLFVVFTLVVNTAIGQYANREDVYAQRQTQFEMEVSRLQDPVVADRLLTATLEEIQRYGGNNPRYDAYLQTTAMNAWFTLIDNAVEGGNLTQARTYLTDLQQFATAHSITNPAIGLAEGAIAAAEASIAAGTDASNATQSLTTLTTQLGWIDAAYAAYDTNPTAQITVTDRVNLPALSGVESWIGEITTLRTRITTLEGQITDLEEQVDALENATPPVVEIPDSLCLIDNVPQTLTNSSGWTLTLSRCRPATESASVTYMVCWQFDASKPSVCYPQMEDGQTTPSFFASSGQFNVRINGDVMTPSGYGTWTPRGGNGGN